MASSDRCVHARLPNGAEIVRYDRAGKWYIENPAEQWRRQITINEAARFAGYPHAEVFTGLSGGRLFDAKVVGSSAASSDPA